MKTHVKLDQFHFHQNFPGKDVWTVHEFKLGEINLIVGRNGVGKTRLINVINSLAEIVSGSRTGLGSGAWEVKFRSDDDDNSILYELEFEDKSVISERFTLLDDKTNPNVLMHRGQDGEGEIFSQPVNDKIEFQANTEQVVVFSRQDAKQHPFFAPVVNWGKHTLTYRFTKKYAETQLALRSASQSNPHTDPENNIADKLTNAIQNYGEDFKKQIIKDMKKIGYNIDEINVDKPELNIKQNLPGPLYAIYIKESDLPFVTWQMNMASGLFRALSILIDLNWRIFESDVRTLLIDDIGEGLDFERSSDLIKLIIEKCKNSGIQLICSTNDRFIMNSVPLECWNLVKRIGTDVRVYNYFNSEEVFEQFRMSGLNNFDFFATDFIEQ